MGMFADASNIELAILICVCIIIILQVVMIWMFETNKNNDNFDNNTIVQPGSESIFPSGNNKYIQASRISFNSATMAPKADEIIQDGMCGTPNTQRSSYAQISPGWHRYSKDS